jgi:hypothetical protein
MLGEYGATSLPIGTKELYNSQVPWNWLGPSHEECKKVKFGELS